MVPTIRHSSSSRRLLFVVRLLDTAVHAFKLLLLLTDCARCVLAAAVVAAATTAAALALLVFFAYSLNSSTEPVQPLPCPRVNDV